MGPKNPVEALGWIQETVAQRRYSVHPHAIKRFAQRRLSMADVRHAIAHATTCTEYTDRKPIVDGTSWRVMGPDIDGEEMTVGVEAFKDHLGKRSLVITVF